MLSRRRRVSSASHVRYNDKSVEDDDVVRVAYDRVVVAETFGTSTETSKTPKQNDKTLFATSRRDEKDVGTVGLKIEESASSDVDVLAELSSRETDVTLDKSLTIGCNESLNNRRATMQQRCVDVAKRRRRKSVEILDRNVDVFQINCSFTNRRVVIDPRVVDDSASLTTDTSKRDKSLTDDRTSRFVADCDAASLDHEIPSPSIYPNIPDNVKISRTMMMRGKKPNVGPRPRLKFHCDGEVKEHKSIRRRRTDDDCRHDTTKSQASSYWTCPKNRYVVILGLLLWTTIMVTEVTGRQNHHRTCPGCPHQHGHTIHRKSGVAIDDGSDDNDDNGSETSPSPDDLRLEAIKHQILTKLGLRTRPDVNRTLASVPRHLALETLYRAEAQPRGHSNEPDVYHDDGRRDHHRDPNDIEDEDSLSSSSSSKSSSSSLSSSSSSSLSSSLSSSSSSLSSSLSSSSSSSKSSSSLSSSSSSPSSSYGQFYYDGEEYAYRNLDQDALDKSSRDDEKDRMISGSYDERHRSDYRNDGKHGNNHVSDGGDDDDVDDNDEGQIEVDDFYARTSEIISFAEPGRTLNGQPLLEFPRSSGDPALEPLRIKRATLWARVELRHAHHYQHHRRAQNNQRNITLWVFRVRCGNVTHLRGKELGEHLEMVTSLGVNVHQMGWQKFDVTKVVSNWYSGHEMGSTRNEKLTLLVDCTGCGSHVHISTFGAQTMQDVETPVKPQVGKDPDRPFLVVRTDPAAVKRVRRRAIECSGAIKGQCCKQRFYVSFSQLGWDDWIIAPQGYYANYCRGDCAAGHRTPDTFLNYYTHVIEEYRKMDRLAGMQPCCAPLKFSSMSLIYYGPDYNIIKRDLPKMIVDECGCP